MVVVVYKVNKSAGLMCKAQLACTRQNARRKFCHERKALSCLPGYNYVLTGLACVFLGTCNAQKFYRSEVNGKHSVTMLESSETIEPRGMY